MCQSLLKKWTSSYKYVNNHHHHVTEMKRNNHTNCGSNSVFNTLAAHVRFLHLVKNLPEEWKKKKNITGTDFGYNLAANNPNFPSNEKEIKDFIFSNVSADHRYGSFNPRSDTKGDVWRESGQVKESLDRDRDGDKGRDGVRDGDRNRDSNRDSNNGDKNHNGSHRLSSESNSIVVAGDEFFVDERGSSSAARRNNVRTKTEKDDRNIIKISDNSEEGKSLFRESENSEKDLDQGKGKEQERRIQQQQNINISTSSTLFLSPSRTRTPLCHLFSSSPPPSSSHISITPPSLRSSLPLSSSQKTQRLSQPFNQQMRSNNMIENHSENPWTRVNTRSTEAPSEVTMEVSVSKYNVIVHDKQFFLISMQS